MYVCVCVCKYALFFLTGRSSLLFCPLSLSTHSSLPLSLNSVQKLFLSASPNSSSSSIYHVPLSVVRRRDASLPAIRAIRDLDLVDPSILQHKFTLFILLPSFTSEQNRLINSTLLHGIFIISTLTSEAFPPCVKANRGQSFLYTYTHIRHVHT